MAGNANSGAKPFNDRKLAAEVRSLTLNKMKHILNRPVVEMNERDKQLHDELILKLAGSILPRLTEVTGEDGEKLDFGVVILPKKNGSTDGAENTLEAPAKTGGSPSE